MREHAVEENSERMIILSSTETYLLHHVRSETVVVSDRWCLGKIVDNEIWYKVNVL